MVSQKAWCIQELHFCLILKLPNQMALLQCCNDCARKGALNVWLFHRIAVNTTVTPTTTLFGFFFFFSLHPSFSLYHFRCGLMLTLSLHTILWNVNMKNIKRPFSTHTTWTKATNKAQTCTRKGSGTKKYVHQMSIREQMLVFTREKWMCAAVAAAKATEKWKSGEGARDLKLKQRWNKKKVGATNKECASISTFK